MNGKAESEEALLKGSGRILYDQIKGSLKRLPVVRWLLQFKGELVDKKDRIRELSSLIKEEKTVFFPLYSRRGSDVALDHDMIHDIVKEWLDLYGIIHLRKTTAAAIHSPAGAVLLYMPQALLQIPSTHEEYLQGVRRETRKEIRLAEKQGYEFKEFCWNDYLKDIFEINTSKEIRQSEPMKGWYREPVQPRYHTKEELQSRKYYGAFKDERLYAYFHFLVCGDFAVGKHIIGHAQHLKFGIMNGLISFSVRECIKIPQVRWLYYGRYQQESLSAFKKHAGFQEYAIVLDLERDQNLLKYSERAVKTNWRI